MCDESNILPEEYRDSLIKIKEKFDKLNHKNINKKIID